MSTFMEPTKHQFIVGYALDVCPIEKEGRAISRQGLRAMGLDYGQPEYHSRVAGCPTAQSGACFHQPRYLWVL